MPTVYLKKDSGGKVLLVGGKVALNPACCCGCPEGTFSITLDSAAISGAATLVGAPCEGLEVTVSGTAVTPVTSACGESCLTDPDELSYTCPEGCPPGTGEPATFTIEVVLESDGSPGAHWFLTIHAQTSANLCGQSVTFGGDDVLTGYDLGEDPTGEQIVSFDDPNDAGVHYDVTFTVNP